MFKAAKENPITTFLTVLSIISILGGGVATMYTIFEKLDSFVTEAELEEKSDSISIEILTVAIMRYEDDLMRLEIKIQTNTANDFDRAQKINIDRRLLELKAKKLILETKSVHP